MALHINKIGLAALTLSLIGFAAMPVHVLAQDGPDTSPASQTNDITNKKIDIDLESSNLYYGLKLLFAQVKANFTIDESLKSLTITAHLTQVPFRVALETLLKSTSTPLTYKVENGIYSVVPKVETVDPGIDVSVQVDPRTPTTGGWKLGMIRTNNLSDIDIVLALGGTIVSVGYQPPAFGQGGLGGGMGAGSNSGQNGGSSGFGNTGNGTGGLFGSNNGFNGGSGSQFGNSGRNGSGGNNRGGGRF